MSSLISRENIMFPVASDIWGVLKYHELMFILQCKYPEETIYFVYTTCTNQIKLVFSVYDIHLLDTIVVLSEWEIFQKHVVVFLAAL